MPTTRVEEILKNIHILFAKGESYQNSPDMIILSKNEMFTLLEELNEAMYEVLDHYEATTRAKEMARLETEREASEIIAEAKRNAEEVHVASLAYTDTMLDELGELINSTKDGIRREYLELLAKIDERTERLDANREDVKDSLKELHESERYIAMLEETRKMREDKRDAALSKSAGSKAVNKDSTDNSGEEWPEEEKKPAPVIRIDKPGQNAGITITNKHDRNKKKKNAPAPTTATGPETMSEETLSALKPEERDALEQSTPEYGQGFKAEDFNLDAEWEQFKDENEKKENSSNDAAPKKGFRFFGRKNK